MQAGRQAGIHAGRRAAQEASRHAGKEAGRQAGRGVSASRQARLLTGRPAAHRQAPRRAGGFVG